MSVDLSKEVPVDSYPETIPPTTSPRQDYARIVANESAERIGDL